MENTSSQELPKGAHPSFLNVLRAKERVKQNMANVKHKIGVYSAKGGVGKTTVAINLAYALSQKNLRVGLLDADIDCPNVTMFLGIDEKIDPHAPLKLPVKDGVKIASTAMLVDELKKPIIWRGPLITKMLSDFFEHADWGELDYLVLDLSPGTSDAPLTIMQLLDLDGFVIVTTPQKIAGLNSIRSGLMAKRLGVHILGVVENMSSGEPSQSTLDVVAALGTEFLGCIKRDDLFNRLSDSGTVPVLAEKRIKEDFDAFVSRLLGHGVNSNPEARKA
jgi:ATP-binding protein involved in chromosome partitioning